MPDIDHPQSILGSLNPFAKYMKHRGWTHTIIGCALLSLPFLLFDLWIFLSTFIGCLSHLLGDKLYSFFPGKAPFYIKFL